MDDETEPFSNINRPHQFPQPSSTVQYARNNTVMNSGRGENITAGYPWVCNYVFVLDFLSHLNEQLNNNHLTHRQQIQGFTYQQATFNPPKRNGQTTATNATIDSRPRGVIFNMDGTFEAIDPPMKTPASGWNKQPGNITSAHRPIHLFPGSAGKREQGSHYVRGFLFCWYWQKHKAPLRP